MECNLALDFISDLPGSIIESILSRMPIRDAVRTSILSRKWRYKWTTLRELVFDEKCVSVSLSDNEDLVEDKITDFITRALLLHHGPIHKFQISTAYLRSCPDIDQWILFLSRNDLKELILELGDGEWFVLPSCLFFCKRLCRLELCRCKLRPPLGFKGFSCLKSLNLSQVWDSCDVIESVIASCPLLESLALSYVDSLALSIHAPNLKDLSLEGEFKDICLEQAPLLVALTVVMYMNDDIAEHMEQSTSCNFINLLGGVPSLERLVGHVYFTKYLSIGNSLERCPITYSNLKIVELCQVGFEDLNEILVVLQLIMNSPILQELHISGSSNTVAAVESDLEFWSLPVCLFKRLRIVKMIDMSGVQPEMEFIKFMLKNSPVLEVMSIQPGASVVNGTINMLTELVRYRRASSRVEVFFVQD